MKPTVIVGMIILVMLWLWLCMAVIRADGFNLKNLFVIAASGIIIFVPLWKKYIRRENK